MSNTHSTFDDSPTEQSFPWSCLLGGCATVLLLVVLGIAATGYATFRVVRGQIDAYTSDKPVVIPVAEYSEEEIAAARKLIDDFKAALEKGESQDPLVLTADDINAMISSKKELAGRLFVKIEEGEISGEASFPVDAIPFLKGRYFNGSVSLKASLQDGVLVVTLDEATVNGKPVPEEVMKEIRQENLAKDALKDRDFADFLLKFESLSIEDDRIILTPAKKSSEESATDSKATPANAAQAEITDAPDYNAPVSDDSEPSRNRD